MKSILLQTLSLCTCTAALATLAKTDPTQYTMAQLDNQVPGHNDATYDTVPENEQIFKIEFLEIAPTPIIADRVFFVYLRGCLPESKKKELALPDEALINATLKISASVVYPDGSHDNEDSIMGPLKTTPFNNLAHLTIRDTYGVQVDYMPSSDCSEILLDFQFLTMFLRTGMWTFKVDARAGDTNNTCLFAMKLTQWLEGRLN
ncbi:hypothetical protein ASPACDRAFT_124110 [Aspergillus aculeatus ATCC 16872]|uniref:Ubiquitin 3 binding protein But2 C-terminal domain-containing protein n=2 Tax=Aspergillus subgen. Circumdati TaxID=2720871 RepID=A0A1L9WMA1_ASPA1|nr:uncharacterized protein ASPACDRAFT_124110 [Aspergillus aculeatus ATCC 16872]XP_025522586.1 hypothetical protein BO86DRAFT_372299 [Aspergillus japonicus CBS 114.51]OJJ97230.1 hypothetical protein ASPACDRAFT_124110 [Aspergillus aculeatus ATCC 16872]RAH76692.1 hypothetical protein BO86DRAFT_372299 [Aspergillus japonicus CBS 114.51]